MVAIVLVATTMQKATTMATMVAIARIDMKRQSVDNGADGGDYAD